MLDIFPFACIIGNVDAGVAHPVERHLAKVEVASSSLVARSIKPIEINRLYFFNLITAGMMELVDM